ncbi:hypothetical protein NE664_11580 [Anaerotignum faecicola]|nr:hypothetical protein [Anaerotignum faecicola]
MKNKRLISAGLITLFLVLMVVKIYGVTDILTLDLVRDRENPESRKKIAEIVLNDAGVSDQYQPEEVMSIRTFYGDLTGDNNEDLVIVTEIGPTVSYISAYAQDGNNFTFLDSIGPMATIENLELTKAPSLDRDFIVVRENINQKIGAFENSTYYKFYIWDNENLREAGVLPERVRTDWNLAWDSQNQTSPSDWRRIDMDADIAIQDPVNSELLITLYQRYLKSSDTANKSVPADDTYSVIAERTIPATLKWSPEWLYFIVSEKIDNATGEKVAVIEDMAYSPYALVPEYSDTTKNKYRILRKDGTQEIVDKGSVRDI